MKTDAQRHREASRGWFRFSDGTLGIPFDAELGVGEGCTIGAHVPFDFYPKRLSVSAETVPNFLIDDVRVIGRGTMAGASPIAYQGDTIELSIRNIDASAARTFKAAMIGTECE